MNLFGCDVEGGLDAGRDPVGFPPARVLPPPGHLGSARVHGVLDEVRQGGRGREHTGAKGLRDTVLSSRGRWQRREPVGRHPQWIRRIGQRPLIQERHNAVQLFSRQYDAALQPAPDLPMNGSEDLACIVDQLEVRVDVLVALETVGARPGADAAERRPTGHEGRVVPVQLGTHGGDPGIPADHLQGLALGMRQMRLVD